MKPFLPSDIQASDRLKPFFRMATVKAVAGLTSRDVNQTARRLYGPEAGDNIVKNILKAAVAPADTSTTAWAGALTGTIVGPFLKSLRGVSAASQLMELGQRFDLRGGSISLPRLSAEFPNAAWVVEAGPSPVFQGALASTVLTPKKLLALCALTNELAERGAEDAERIISYLLTQSVGRALDAKVLSADAATSAAPAGLLNGIAATAGTAGGGTAAMLADLKALTSAVSTAGGGGNLVIIANPAQAISLQVLSGTGLAIPVVIAPTLANATVIVLDLSAFVSGFGADPQIDVSDGAVVHLEDANPLAIGTAGSPNTVAAKTVSAFQADFKVLRCFLRVAYGLRAPALAFTTTATW